MKRLRIAVVLVMMMRRVMVLPISHAFPILPLETNRVRVRPQQSGSASSRKRIRWMMDYGQPQHSITNTEGAAGGARFAGTGTGAGGGQWDNDHYLEALGQGAEALAYANQEYIDAYSSKRSVPANANANTAPSTASSSSSSSTAGAVLTDAMKAHMKQSHEASAEGSSSSSSSSQGGELFRTMLSRAQLDNNNRIISASNAISSSQSAKDNGNGNGDGDNTTTPPLLEMENLTVDQQAELFRRMMADQQSPLPAQSTPPPPPPQVPQSQPQPPQRGDRHRKSGRNRDADAIVNSSDVYFAQLKLDSSIRNLARYQGNDATANAVFADPNIRNIKAHVNPGLQAMRRHEQALLETAAEEILVSSTLRNHHHHEEGSPITAPAHRPHNAAGPRYKTQLLQQKKKQKQKQAMVNHADAAVVEEESKTTRETTAAMPPHQVSSDVHDNDDYEDDDKVLPLRPTHNNNNIVDDEEDRIRSEIRLLMGLLLKHRGGPGFGRGRLQTDADIAKFQAVANDVLHQLHQEAITTKKAKASLIPKSSSSSSSSFDSSSSSSSLSTTNASSITSTTTTILDAKAHDATDAQENNTEQRRIQAGIACLEGAIQMYRNSPVELRASVMTMLRAALVSAVHAIAIRSSTSATTSANESSSMSIEAPMTMTPDTTTNLLQEGDNHQERRINGMIALIEGAITMYKNSPIDLRANILGTLRAALVSAIETMDRMSSVRVQPPRLPSVSDDDPSDTNHHGAASTTHPDTSTSSPAVSSSSSIASNDDDDDNDDHNSVFFKSVRAKLEQVKGDGIMGLRTDDLDSVTATDLADDLAKMRALLIDELP